MVWRIIAYIAVMLVIILLVIMENKWYYAYKSIKQRYHKLQQENVRLQQEIYKLTYTIPNMPKGKREK